MTDEHYNEIMGKVKKSAEKMNCNCVHRNEHKHEHGCDIFYKRPVKCWCEKKEA